jgi:hypothetical protein
MSGGRQKEIAQANDQIHLEKVFLLDPNPPQRILPFKNLIIDAKRFEENYYAELGYSCKAKRVVKDFFYLPMGKFFDLI